MDLISRFEVMDVLRGFNFSVSEHLTEIADGNGALISSVLVRYDNMERQPFDLPDVIDRIESIPYLKTASVNMHTSLPESTHYRNDNERFFNAIIGNGQDRDTDGTVAPTYPLQVLGGFTRGRDQRDSERTASYPATAF